MEGHYSTRRKCWRIWSSPTVRPFIRAKDRSILEIKQDKERLEKLQKRIQREQIKYEPARNVSKIYNEIDRMGQKTITGKMAISKEDYSELTALAKEGITSRDRKSTRLNSSHITRSRMPSSA